MKRIFLWFPITCGALFASDPLQVPLEGKVYLTQLNETFLDEIQEKDWVFVVKEWEGKKISFSIPSDFHQKSEKDHIYFEAKQKGVTYQVEIFPLSEKMEQFFQSQKRHSLATKIESKYGEMVELELFEGKKRFLLTQEALISLSILGKSGSDKEQEAFFSSLQVIKPKKH